MNFEKTPHQGAEVASAEVTPINTPLSKLHEQFTELESYTAQIEQRYAELMLENQQLKLENEKLEKIATQDFLTGLLNRNGLFMKYESLVRNNEREKTPTQISVAFVDLKGLKDMNDTHGHDAGDALLAQTATVMQDHSRPGDLCARWGGDEFVLVLPNTSETGAHAAIDRIIANLPENIHVRIGIVASDDLAHIYGKEPTLTEVLTIADDLTNDARGTESRTDFKKQSDIRVLSNALKD